MLKKNSFIEEIIQLIHQATLVSHEKISPLVEIPPKAEMGDYAFPCFELAKEMRKAPPQVAQEIVQKIGRSSRFASVAAAGPYVNFKVDPSRFYREVLSAILERDTPYGSSQTGAGKTVVIDFSSPNMARPLNIAHLGTTAAGAALQRIYSFLGYRAVGINYLGDWGTQFGKLIAAFQRWGDQKTLASHPKPVLYLVDLYVRFHKEVETDPSLEEEARATLLKCEQGDQQVTDLWRRFCAISHAELDKIYQRLGIEFDFVDSESQYNAVLDDTIENIRRRGLARESEGALIADLEKFELPPILLRRSDGASLYSTRDIAAAFDRYERFHFDRMIYVVGSEQRLHFQQLFALLKEMGYPWADRCTHLALGQVTLEGEKMSTRRGQVIFLDDVLDKAIDLARKIIEEKNPDLRNKEEVAKEVGIGAVLFNRFSQRQNKDIVFDWDRALSFEGETGPYLQYTHARACSILRKAGMKKKKIVGEVFKYFPDWIKKWSPTPPAIDWTLLGNPEEHDLIKLLDRWPSLLESATWQNEPYVVARHLLDISAAFNKFYNLHRVIDSAAPSLQSARLAIVSATQHILETGLGLLGIAAPQEM
ncbi:MAG: arginine--tRNA ligase [Deltaproteobacteria bacterium]|nr:arginine--tRNA ligase [Deltaproteobacteria bacterium]